VIALATHTSAQVQTFRIGAGKDKPQYIADFSIPQIGAGFLMATVLAKRQAHIKAKSQPQF
jgi:hypothetical protein